MNAGPPEAPGPPPGLPGPAGATEGAKGFQDSPMWLSTYVRWPICFHTPIHVAPTIGLREPEKVISLPSANHAVLPLSIGAPSGMPSVPILPSDVYLKAHKPTIGANGEDANSSSAACRKSAFMKRAGPKGDAEFRRSDVGIL